MNFNQFWCVFFDIAQALNVAGACKPKNFLAAGCLIKSIRDYAQGNLHTLESGETYTLGPWTGDKYVTIIACDGNAHDVLYSIDGGENQLQVADGEGETFLVKEGDTVEIEGQAEDCFRTYIVNA